jgi:hypothetical protein
MTENFPPTDNSVPEAVTSEAQITKLRSDISSLATLTSKLVTVQAEQISAQSIQIKKGKRLTIIALTGLILDITLTMLGAFLVARVNTNADNIRAIQSKVSTQAFCPLYDLFLGSYNPQSPQAKADPKAYENTIVIIEHGAVALGCAHNKRGPG